MKYLVTSAALFAASAASTMSAQALTFHVDLSAVETNWGYYDEAYQGFNFAGSVTFGETSWIDQADFEILSYRNTEDTDEEAFESEKLTLHFDLPFTSFEAAGFAGAWADGGYENEANDYYAFGGLSAQLVTGSKFDLQAQAGIVHHVKGYWASVNPNLGFAVLTAGYQATDALSFYSKLSIYSSFGDFGDTVGERIDTNAATLGARLALSDRTQIFAEYNVQEGGWDTSSDYDTSSVEVGLSLTFGGSAATMSRPKWEPIDFAPISWVRLEGW